VSGDNRTLILDIGGVFYRGWPDETFWPRWTVRTGLSRAVLEGWLSTDVDAHAARLGRITAATYNARAAERFGVPAATFSDMLREAYASEFNEDLAGFIRRLAGRGVPIWALTNSLSTESELMARPGFEGLFLGIVSSRDVGMAKPDSEIFRLALQRAEVSACDAVFLDDAPAHVAAAKRLGMDALRFRSTAQAIADLTARFGGP